MANYFEELKRRNVFRAVIAYVVLGWILLQVSTNLEEALNLPAWFDAVVTALLAIGLPVVAVFSWVYELTPDGLYKTSDVPPEHSVTTNTGRRLDIFTAVGVVILIGLVLADRFMPGTATEEVQEPVAAESVADTATAEVPAEAEVTQTTAEKSIAVLPFVAMSDSRDDEFFADGLSEELLNVLAKIDELKVAGRTSSFYYKGRNEDLRTIAEALGVAHILEGSVRRSGDTIRITAQLIKADDGFHLWSDTYDRKSDDIFAIQDEISSSVAQVLRTEILGESRSQSADNEKSAEAENLALVAQAALSRRNVADVSQARDLFAQASILDPANPRYLAGYAEAVAIQYWNYRNITAEEAITQSSEAIEKALNLGTPSADTLAVAGLVAELRALAENDQDAKQEALRYYQQAVDLESSNVRALQWLASIYLDIIQPEQSRIYFERVVELDPLNQLALAGLANAYLGLGRFEDARLHLFKMQSLFPDQSMVYRYLGNIGWQEGRLDHVIFWMEKAVAADPNPLEVGTALYGYRMLGWADKALETAEYFRQVDGGVDLSRLVQAEIDRDYEAVAEEARILYEEHGEGRFATITAWSAAVVGRCRDAITVLDKQYPSLRGEIIEYIASEDVLDAVLLGYCEKQVGNADEGTRLIRALLASPLFAENAVNVDMQARVARIAAHAVGGNTEQAIRELNELREISIPVAIAPVSLDVDELPVFESLYDEPDFKDFANQREFEIARQARMLASGETEQEVVAMVEAAGYSITR